MTQNEGRSKLGWLQPVVVAVLIALLAGTTSPWWWSELKAVIVGANKPSQSEAKPELRLSQTSSPGQQAPAPKSASLSVSITAPPNNSEVNVHDFIIGKVSDKDSRIWLVIQPLETMACWVQKPVIVDDDGTWKASVQFGDYTVQHSGKPYEVRALANPRSTLTPGPTECWPQAEAASAGLYVKRR
jgi:hypothetical protein